MKCDGTRAETRFRLSARNGRVHLNRPWWVSVQSTAGNRGVRISGSNAGYTMFRGSVKGTGYPLPFASFPFTSPPVRHRVPSHFNWCLPATKMFLFASHLALPLEFINNQIIKIFFPFYKNCAYLILSQRFHQESLFC